MSFLSLVLSWGVQVYLLINGYNQVAGPGIFDSFFLNPVLNVVLRCVKVLQVKWPYMSLLEPSQAKRYGYPNLVNHCRCQWLSQLLPLCSARIKPVLHYIWHLALWKVFRHKTGTESRALPRMFGSHHRHICHLCVFFSEVQESQAEPTCNYMPKVKEACSMLLSADEKN